MSSQWTPSVIQTQLWLDAADSSTHTVASGAVSEWRDKSGNGYHVSQGTSNHRPLLISSAQNGLPVVRFDGLNDRLIRSAPHDLCRSVTELHIFAVRRFRVSPSLTQWIYAQYLPGSTTVTSPFIGGGTVASKSRAAVRRNSSTNTSGVDSTASVDGFEIHAVHANFSSSTVEQRISGSVDGSVSIDGAGATPDAQSSKIVIGAATSESSFFFDGDIAEIIYCHNLASGDRERVEGYLAHKWGLSSKLPAWHPYKSVPPGTGNLSGNATVVGGSAVDVVSVHRHDSKERVALIYPSQNGDWTAVLGFGLYDVVYWADGCQPVAHGPYFVEAD